jgi:hypothetical protein
MPTWCFKTQEQLNPYTASPQWYWQIDAEHTLIAISSSRVFATLEQCIAHARAHGFRGTVEVPQTLTYPAVIRCEDEDYMPGLMQAPSSGRARRSAR